MSLSFWMFWRLFIAILAIANAFGTIADIRSGDVKFLRGFEEPIYRATQPTEFWAFIGLKFGVSVVFVIMIVLTLSEK
jgi:hypothetical protein